MNEEVFIGEVTRLLRLHCGLSHHPVHAGSDEYIFQLDNGKVLHYFINTATDNLQSKPTLVASLSEVTALWINGYMPNSRFYEAIPGLETIYTTRICSHSIPEQHWDKVMPFVLEADYDSDIEDWRYEGQNSDDSSSYD